MAQRVLPDPIRMPSAAARWDCAPEVSGGLGSGGRVTGSRKTGEPFAPEVWQGAHASPRAAIRGIAVGTGCGVAARGVAGGARRAQADRGAPEGRCQKPRRKPYRGLPGADPGPTGPALRARAARASRGEAGAPFAQAEPARAPRRRSRPPLVRGAGPVGDPRASHGALPAPRPDRGPGRGTGLPGPADRPAGAPPRPRPCDPGPATPAVRWPARGAAPGSAPGSGASGRRASACMACGTALAARARRGCPRPMHGGVPGAPDGAAGRGAGRDDQDCDPRPAAPRPLERVDRRLGAPAPDRPGVAERTRVATGAGFVPGAFARRPRRLRGGRPRSGPARRRPLRGGGPVHRSDRGGRRLSTKHGRGASSGRASHPPWARSASAPTTPSRTRWSGSARPRPSDVAAPGAASGPWRSPPPSSRSGASRPPSPGPDATDSRTTPPSPRSPPDETASGKDGAGQRLGPPGGLVGHRVREPRDQVARDVGPAEPLEGAPGSRAPVPRASHRGDLVAEGGEAAQATGDRRRVERARPIPWDRAGRTFEAPVSAAFGRGAAAPDPAFGMRPRSALLGSPGSPPRASPAVRIAPHEEPVQNALLDGRATRPSSAPSWPSAQDPRRSQDRRMSVRRFATACALVVGDEDRHLRKDTMSDRRGSEARRPVAVSARQILLHRPSTRPRLRLAVIRRLGSRRRGGMPRRRRPPRSAWARAGGRSRR